MFISHNFSQIDDMRGRLDDVNKENVEVQREIGRLKDELSAMNRKAEAESTKMADRLKGVLQKVCVTFFCYYK